MNKAPWPDFFGNEIYEGDTIRHPSGEEGVIAFHQARPTPEDQWVVKYFDNAFESRLCLQIGDRGQAVIVSDSA